MAGPLPSWHAASARVFWMRELRRAAMLLAAGVALFWSSLAGGQWIVPITASGPIFGDVLLAGIAAIVHISAWPNLWAGLRDLRSRQPNESSLVVAWRAFLLSLLVAVAAVVLLPLEYGAIPSADAWIFILYGTAIPYLGWSLVPILALHGIVFGRVARSLDSPFRYVADVGALTLFTVAAATTVTILQGPGAIAFVQAWSLGGGVLPAAAAFGYGLIAFGMRAYSTPEGTRIPTWTRRRPHGSSGERSVEIFR